MRGVEVGVEGSIPSLQYSMDRKGFFEEIEADRISEGICEGVWFSHG